MKIYPLDKQVEDYLESCYDPDTGELLEGITEEDMAAHIEQLSVDHETLLDSIASGIKNDDDDEAAQLQDETFTGSILPMAVPREFILLASEVAAWVQEYGSKVLSPYQSENVIGVYSYTKANGSGSGDGGSASPTWESVFASRLHPYRKTGMLL